MRLFCAVALGGKANWISVSCTLKAEMLMLLISLSSNHLPHSYIAQTSPLVLKAWPCQEG